MRHGECLHRDIADRKLSAGRKQSPVPASLRETTGPKRLGREPIAVNWQVKLVAENFKAADVIGVFVRENHAIELLRRYATLFQPQDHLARAETPINEKFAVIRCNQRTVSRAPAAEHRQAEHGSKASRLISDNANGIVTRTILSVNVSR